jgi:protein gp37
VNKQYKSQTQRGIEWTDYTWNPISGCLHGCAWTMPDGTTANCYAEDVANKLAQAAYPKGFEYHYWRPTELTAPLSVKKPSRIFCGSMADVFGHWVPDDQIRRVLEICATANQHTFQFLTKNAPRLKNFIFPPNCWIGVSVPPSEMNGKPLSYSQRQRMFIASLTALSNIKATVKWMSVEPLSWNVALDMHDFGVVGSNPILNWAVVGAASSGPKIFQPEPHWVDELVDVFQTQGVKVFFKGNLHGNEGADPWREEFPEVA